MKFLCQHKITKEETSRLFCGTHRHVDVGYETRTVCVNCSREVYEYVSPPRICPECQVENDRKRILYAFPELRDILELPKSLVEETK